MKTEMVSYHNSGSKRWSINGKEFDTYKVGTVANSCSTMHKIHEKGFSKNDFSHEHLCKTKDELMTDFNDFIGIEYKEHASPYRALSDVIEELNQWRDFYIYYKNKPYKDQKEHDENLKKIWWQMIQLLPSSYNQKRTVMLNYEVLANIYKSRRNHKLDEWHTFCDWIEGLPYSELITGPTIRDISISHQVIGPDTSEMLKKKFTKNEEW
jgi:hypothetical protein|nr:MAG TPA: hypothetical protein [Bacteriophage sp.]